MIKRIIDVVLAVIACVLLALPIVVVAILVKLTSKGPALFWSKRFGKNNVLFEMPKFRSMRIDTPQVATHLLEKPASYLTPIGGFIRRSSLDELPQLWCVLTGDMSIVGPRPALFNQQDLIALRTKHGVDKLLPGITGYAQIMGRDELSIEKKVVFDKEYLDKSSIRFDCWIVLKTVQKVLLQSGVSH